MFLPSLAGGGAERVFVYLANQFAAWGRKIDLVLLRREGSYLASVDPRVRIVDLQSSNAFGVLALARYLRNQRPIIVVSAMSVFNVMALVAAHLARRRTRVIATEHLHLSAHVRHSTKLYVNFLPTVVARIYHHAAHIVAVSVGVADDLAAITRLDRSRITVVYNPIMIPTVDESRCVPPDWPSNEIPVVVSAGRLDAQKDYPTLLAAFAQVVATRPAVLIILGEGPEKPRLEALIDGLGIRASVQLRGFVSNPHAYFAHAELFVLASCYEGFGVVIVEALACGCPVVATDCPSGPAEILDHGRYGTLVPVGDVPAMAMAIDAALNRCADRQALRHRASEFAVEASARAYLDIIDGCIDRSGRSVASA